MNKELYYTQRDGSLYTKKTKREILDSIDENNPDTFLYLLKEMNYPYFKQIWDQIHTLHPNAHNFGRYIAKMKLMSFKYYTWDDSIFIDNGKIGDRIMIKVFTLNKNNKIELTEKELKQILDEAYWEGYHNGSHTTYTYTSPSILTPYYYTTCTNGTTGSITLTSTSASDINTYTDNITSSTVGNATITGNK